MVFLVSCIGLSQCEGGDNPLGGQPYQALPSTSMGNGTVNFAGEHR